MGKIKNDILQRWEVTGEDLTEVIDGNPSLRGMLLGYLGETKAKKMWFDGRSKVTNVKKYDDLVDSMLPVLEDLNDIELEHVTRSFRVFVDRLVLMKICLSTSSGVCQHFLKLLLKSWRWT